MNEKRSYSDKTIIEIRKNSALYREQRFSGITYNQLYPLSTIFYTKDIDLRNFNTSYRRKKELERKNIIDQLDKFKETQFQYTEE